MQGVKCQGKVTAVNSVFTVVMCIKFNLLLESSL